MLDKDIEDLIPLLDKDIPLFGIGIGMWGAAALSLTSDVPLATGNGGPRGLCHRKPDGRHTCSASRSWEMGG